MEAKEAERAEMVNFIHFDGIVDTLWIVIRKLNLQDFFIAVFWIVKVAEAQLLPTYSPQLYNVPSYVNMGINSYTQTRKLTKAANQLGVPTIPPQTLAKLTTDVGIPLALQAHNLARLGGNAGLPLLPKTPSFPRPAGLVGLPMIPTSLPGGLPILPQIQPRELPSLKLNRVPSAAMLLQSNPLVKRESPLQTRSTSNVKNVGRERSDSSIDPVGQNTGSKDEGVLGYQNGYSQVHRAKIRSPIETMDVDELDYLTQAANPLDDLKPKIGSMVNKMKKEFKHAVDKVDKSLRQSGDKSQAKEATEEDENTAPYTVWVKDPAGEKHDLTDSVKDKLVEPSQRDSDADKQNKPKKQEEDDRAMIEGMNQYVKMKTNEDPENLPERMPAEFASNLRNTMSEFQKSIAQSSLMQKAKSASGDSDGESQQDRFGDNRKKSSEDEPSKGSTRPGSNQRKNSDPKEKSQISKSSRDNDKKPSKTSDSDRNNEKSVSQSRSGDDYANNMKNSGKSNTESNIDEKPLEKFWEKASSLAKSISDAQKKESDESDSDPKVGTTHHHHHYGGFPPNNNLYTLAYPASINVYPGFYDNNYQNYALPSYNPYYSGLVQAYYPYQSSSPIWNSAIGLAESIVDHSHGNRYYKRSAQDQTQTGTTAQIGASYSGAPQSPEQQNKAGLKGRLQVAQRISPAAVQMAQGIAGGNYQGITRSAVGLGQAIAGTTKAGYNSGRFVKRSNQVDTIYTPSMGLADSIYSVASDRGPIDGVKVLDSIGRIWTPATNLAQNIQNYSPKSKENGSSQASEPAKDSQKDKPTESAAKKPSKADSTDKTTKTKPKTESEKPKSEKTEKSKSESDSTAKVDKKPTPASPVSDVVKSATDLAQKITTLAVDPTSYQYNPNVGASTGTIWDSAVDMSGQIVGAMNPRMYQTGYGQQSMPSIVGSYYPRNIQPSVFPTGSLWSPLVGGNTGLTYSYTK
ncbi:hypothetical protein QAD02_008644 [Eretmocerus hayati]|uniref:Uncharacterized protein n=1 Tax=Eretmocerus hayati TaxID=131215 RepID=A0ACC2N7E0_9HYME|nr:hypothetical protein QAD02_008644 [Eretmocerus hayati]